MTAFALHMPAARSSANATIHIYERLASCDALVIDASPASRTALVAMLRDFGVGTIVQSSRVQDARRMLEYRRFDIVVCEYQFPDQAMTGQDLLDDLRLASLLPLSTIVIMISSEAAYVNVAEAAEAALDAYLIKPHTEQALRERVIQAFERKDALKPIIDCVEGGEFRQAAELCQQYCSRRDRHWLNAARIGAELWLRLGHPRRAQALFEMILTTRALPWARLGVARSEYHAGGVMHARRTLESLLNDHAGYADAYDVLARMLLDQGEPEQALDALRRGRDIAPGCVSRLLKLGTVAFYHGDCKEAAEALQRASGLGLNSKVFDLQGLVLLGTLQFDDGDGRGLVHSLNALSAAREKQPESPRLRRFESVLAVFRMLQLRRVAEAVSATQQALRELHEPDFDFEAACNLLAVLSRLVAREVNLEELDDRLKVLAARFAVSHTTCELLCRAALGRPEFEAVIRATYQSVCDEAEAAVSHTVGGQPREAVLALLARAEPTLNAKLLDLATHTLERHRTNITDAPDLLQRIRVLNDKYRSYGTQVQLQWRPPGVATSASQATQLRPC